MGLVQETVSSIFLGVLFSAALWGVACAQTWHYYSSRPNDAVTLKVMVAMACVFDTVHQVLVTQGAYDWTVTHFSDELYLLTLPRSGAAEILFALLTGLVMQSFYAYRMWRLSRRSWLVLLPIVLLLLAEIALTTVNVVDTAWSDSWIQLFPRTRRIAPFIFSSILACNAYISVLMCYFLRHRTEHTRTNSLMNRILIYSLSTNALTSSCALAIVVALIIWPEKIIFLPLFWVIVQLGTNSFMMALNMRPYSSQHSDSQSLSLPTLPKRDDRTGGYEPSSRQPQRHWSVYVHTQTITRTDTDNTIKTEDAA